MPWNSTTLSMGVQPAPLFTGRTHAIAFDLTDVALEAVLRAQLLDRPDLYETDLDEAEVVVTDRAAADGGLKETSRVLRLADMAGRNALDSLEPTLILAAMSLLAAGYSIDRARPTVERADGPLPRLSARERQVADLLVDGASNKVIARALDISVHTAKFHVTAIMEKLGARNRADAVSIILREGVVAI